LHFQSAGFSLAAEPEGGPPAAMVPLPDPSASSARSKRARKADLRRWNSSNSVGSASATSPNAGALVVAIAAAAVVKLLLLVAAPAEAARKNPGGVTAAWSPGMAREDARSAAKSRLPNLLSLGRRWRRRRYEALTRRELAGATGGAWAAAHAEEGGEEEGAEEGGLS
jgi:hypothetical protein